MRLSSVHFILTYQCNFECDHCFLHCSPRAKGTFTLGRLKAALGQLKEVKSIKSVGFEGGEPFLFYPLLLACVKSAAAMGFETAIETNTFWATSVEDARLWLKPLREAGLSLLEVSDDAYHHGDNCEDSAKCALIAAQNEMLRCNTICINPPGAEKSAARDRGVPIYSGGPKLRGRAIEKLIDGLPTQPWDTFTECTLEDLRDPKRVHIDAYGHVHLCQGISMGNIWETPLAEMLRAYNPDAHPICGPLLDRGPVELVQRYNVDHAAEYVDECHLCSQACLALVDRFPQYLAPRQVYGAEEV